MAGVFPIAQVQEPYTSIGYIAARTNLPKILQLKHPIDIEYDEENLKKSGGQSHIYIPSKDYCCEHQWSAMDICICNQYFKYHNFFSMGI